ncbi:HupK protein [Rhodovulum adriaticum]|uniref:Hydrogenase expression/formation protein HupK n=1 Tax=Rhodovulum adriaticum TaxID=35804 RepID=A0A4R2NL40_RHOAD|nr:HupK protein [Rhodovulum adriaticum]MBK1635118.1 hypothetical protein [Rhodovulum adriaticum]TCP22231.1 hypothetical protein EV656_10739 [Rhodovulum adriaticum]
MTLAALHIALTPDGARITPPAALGVEAMLLGRRAEDAAALLPRLFNLCRVAQETGARMALDLPVPADTAQALTREILREHLIRVCVLWPRRLGLPPAPLPAPADVPGAVFGPAGRLPDPDGLKDWMASGGGVAPVFDAIARAFGPGEAVADLPAPTPETLCRGVAQENTPWNRHRDSALLHTAERRFGRGPLWRALARLVDLDACARGALDLAPSHINGVAYVPAARGTYAVSARVTGGHIAAFTRHTPTDQLLAPGGALEQSLATLPPAKTHLAPLMVDILDPCLPVQIAEAADA